jgi:hypothetical protein
MENSVELRLWRLGAGGWRLGAGGRSFASFFGSVIVGGGSEEECECETLGAAGGGGCAMMVSGRSAWHISQVVSSAWLRNVQREHCFFASGVGGRGASVRCVCGRGC